MSSESLRILVNHIGPHEALTLDLAPGVSVLSGRCGSGKTSALEAVGASVGDTSQRPTATYLLDDGTGPRIVGAKMKKPPTGQVLLPGIDGKEAGITVSPAGRVTRFGTPAVRVIDGKAFALLTRPGGTPETEGKRRLQGFSDLTGVKASPGDLLDSSLWGIPSVAAIHTGGLVETAEAVNKALYAHRRQLQTTALPAAQAKVASLRAQYGDGLIEGALSPTVAGAYLSEAQTTYQRLVASAAARQQMEATQARLNEGRGPRPDVEGAEREDHEVAETLASIHVFYTAHMAAQPARVDTDAISARVQSLTDQRTRAAARVERLVLELESARDALAHTTKALLGAEEEQAKSQIVMASWDAWNATGVKLRGDVARATDASKASARLAESTRLAAQRWDDAALELAKPIEGATAEDVEAALHAVSSAQLVLSQAQENTRREAVKADLDDEVTALEETQALIDSLEVAATIALQKKVKALLESSGAVGWSVIDGVVYCTHPKHGALVPVSTLSTGELDRAALSLLLAKQPAKQGFTILLLDQEVGNGLDTPTLKALGDIAREHGIHILTGATRDLPELTVIPY